MDHDLQDILLEPNIPTMVEVKNSPSCEKIVQSNDMESPSPLSNVVDLVPDMKEVGPEMCSWREKRKEKESKL